MMPGVNFLTLAERMARLDEAPIRLQADRCLHGQDKDSPCRACVEACPVEAIALHEGVALDAATCVACGACLPVCPTGALDGDDGVADLLRCVANLEPGIALELACAHHPAPEEGSAAAPVVRISGCLAALGPSAYLALFSGGVSAVGLRLDACAACPLAQAATSIPGTAIPAAAALANDLLARCEVEGAVTLLEHVTPNYTRQVYSTKNPPLSRRGLFRVLANEGSRQAARLLSSEAALAGVRGPSRERRRMLAALRHLPIRDADAPLEGLPFARISANDQCTACGVCARACPTAALHFAGDEESAFALSFAPAACIDCGQCLDVCLPAALERSPATLAELLDEDEIILAAGHLRTCARCKAQFAARGDETLCPLCTFRRKNPFGSHLPPGLSRSDRPDRIQRPRDSA